MREDAQKFTVPKAAWMLAVSFLVSLAILTAMTVRDSLNREALEQASETTPIVEVHTFAAPEGSSEGDPTGLQFDGQSLLLSRVDPFELDDGLMQVAGRDDSGSYVVYRSGAQTEEIGPSGELYYFVRNAEGIYYRLEVHPADEAEE